METVLVLALAGVFLFAEAVPAAEWKTEKSRHFVARHTGKDGFARELLRAAEGHYSRIAGKLGYTRRGGFWRWSDRVLIVVYPTREEFHRVTRAPRWVVGRAWYSRREVATFDGCRAFLDSVLPHEVAHLVFRDFVGFEGEVPLWLDEGVAQWSEATSAQRRAWQARWVTRPGGRIPLKMLTALRKDSLRDSAQTALFYAQSASVVGFMVEEHGVERFTKLCRQLRAGKSLEDALRFTYPSSIRSIDELERAWIAYLEEPK